MNGALPFVGSKFGRAELEFAAALVLRACFYEGDAWAPVRQEQIGAAMSKDAESGGLFHHLQRNPFVPRPDFHGLVVRGFARFVGEPDGNGNMAIEFTTAGIDAMRPFAKVTP